MPNALVVLYLAGGQDGMNVIVPNSSADFPLYSQNAADDRAHPGPERRRQGRLAARSRRPAARSRSPRRPSRRAGGGDNGEPHLRLRHALRDRRRRAPDRTSRCFRRPTTSRPTSRISRARTTGSRARWTTLSTGWLGRWLDLYGSPTNPLQGISIGYSLSKSLLSAQAPVCTISSLYERGLRAERRRRRAGRQLQRGRPQRRPRASSRRCPRATRRSRTRATPTGSPSACSSRSARSSQRDVRHRLSGQLLPGLPAAAGGRPARRRLRHARDHDQLGRLRHPRRPDRDPGSAAGRALAVPRRLPGRPRHARHRRPGRDADVLRVRAPRLRTTPRAGPTTAPAG